MLLMPNIHDHFHLPLSEEAFDQFCELTVFLQSIQLNGNKDGWFYIWGSDKYSLQKAYKHLLGHQSVHLAFKWI
jgi:hypothetical protein